MTVGYGLVPREILDERLFHVHEFLRYGSGVQVDYGDSETRLLAARGLFGYENDAFKRASRFGWSRYVRIVEPTAVALLVENLPAELRSYFELVRFDGLWSDTVELNVERAFERVTDWNI